MPPASLVPRLVCVPTIFSVLLAGDWVIAGRTRTSGLGLTSCASGVAWSQFPLIRAYQQHRQLWHPASGVNPRNSGRLRSRPLQPGLPDTSATDIRRMANVQKGRCWGLKPKWALWLKSPAGDGFRRPLADSPLRKRVAQGGAWLPHNTCLPNVSFV